MQIKMNIPYTSLPGYTDLYLDYINNFEKVSKYYQFSYTNDGFLKAIKAKEEQYNNSNINREELSEILKTQNKFYNSGDATFANIDKLKEKNTFAIVTGQQIGMLSGSLYTIFKAINAIQLAKTLSVKFPEYNFVPIFWLEADDHDFLEINNINIIDKKNDALNVKYFQKNLEKERYLTPVGRIVLDEFIKDFINNLEENISHTDFTKQLFEYIKKSYKEGIDLITAFARFINYISGDTGLIFCNPTDKEIKKMLIPVFEKEMVTTPAVCEKIIDTSAELELEYEPQVKPRAINIFYTHNDNRHLIELKEEKFSLRNTRQKFEKDELFNLLYSNTENFSANVILRPICQDYLLPTISYIGGPSEVAYFSQFKDVYKFFEIPMPVIYPRTNITLLESRIENFMDKFNIQFIDIFDLESLSKKIIKQNSSINIDDIFSNMTDELNGIIYLAGTQLKEIDKNLYQNFQNKYDKFIENINISKPKFVEAQLKQNETANNKLKTLVTSLYPENTMQERYFNIIYFINKYGFDFIKELSDTIDIKKLNHQVISISSQGEPHQPALFDSN